MVTIRASYKVKQVFKPEAVCCCLQTCFDIKVILCASVPSLIVRNANTTNKGQVGAWALVHYSGVVLYWGGFVKKPYLCVVSIELYILLVYKLLWSVLEQQ